eukprot:s912_g19.t4
MPAEDIEKLGVFVNFLGGLGSSPFLATFAMGSKGQPLLPKGFQNPFESLARNPKVARYIQSVSDAGDNPKLQESLEALKPYAIGALSILRYVIEVYFRIYSAAYAVVEKLPADELKFLIGFILCFFGGVFVALIAAVEAFRTMGGQSLYDDLAYIKIELDNVVKAHDADEQVDANRDGIRDVEAMGSQELVQHKAMVVMQSINDPKRLQGAVGNLWSAYLAVVATLSLKFAQTTAYALAISEMVKFPVTRVVAPPLAYGLGPNLVNWVDVIIDSTLKAFVILLVWFFAKISVAVAMPGWLDMRETRRVRERVAVASSSLPYWNAEGIFASTGWPTPVASEVSASSLPLAQKLALISDGKGEMFVQSEPSSGNDDPKPSRPGLKADHIGKAQLLSQMKPLRTKAAARRKQPKQGPLPVASASAAQMASKIRRQLLQMCRQAGISPGRLQVEEDLQDDLQSDQQPLEPPKDPKVPVEFLEKGWRPDLATQLRRATMERAQREREIQRRSRAVQTRQTRTVPEMCIKMNPEPTLVPKSVQLEGYHWQTAAKVETQDAPRGQPTCPGDGLFQQGGLISNAEDEIVIGGHHSETGEISSDYLGQREGSPSRDSRWRSREEFAASARQFDGPPPHQTHKTSGIKDQEEERLREKSSVMLGKEPGFDRPQPLSHFPDSGIHSRLQEAWSGLGKARPCEMPLQSRLVQPSTRATPRARGGESYDLTVFQALSRKAFGTDALDPTEEDQPEQPGEQDTPSRPLSDLAVLEPPVNQPISEPPEAMEDGLHELHLDPWPPEHPLDHLEVAPEIGPLEPAAFEPSEDPSSIRSPIQDSDEEDFLRAATPVEPNGDSSDSDVGRSQELPDLPPYRPLPSLQPEGSGDGAAPRLAPKQLEEQFYTSLQILDSVHEHLAQEKLSQQEREAGLEAQMAQQAQLDSTIAWLETTRQAQQQLIQQLQCVEEDAQRSRQAFVADYEARELQRQEETEILERERLEREQSILERQREMLLLLGLTAAFYSGLRGGQMLGAATVQICQKWGLTDSLPFVKKPFNPDESYLDEVIGYPLAILGFYFQMTHYFGVLPFPLDWLLWPLSFVEGLLEIQASDPWLYSRWLSAGEIRLIRRFPSLVRAGG